MAYSACEPNKIGKGLRRAFRNCMIKKRFMAEEKKEPWLNYPARTRVVAYLLTSRAGTLKVSSAPATSTPASTYIPESVL